MNIKIDIFANKIELNPSLREFIEEKIGALDKYISRPTVLRVEISRPSKHHRSGNIFYAEANLKIGDKLLRATAENSDLHTAIAKVRDDLQLQIKKSKEKRLARR
jgi:putative sigma-54 modulation protein